MADQDTAEIIARLEARLATLDEEREKCLTALAALRGDLTPPKDSVNVQSAMLQSHRVQISKSRTDDSLAKVANEAHETMTSLAEAVGVSVSLLSQARHNKCSIAESVALKIQDLTKSKKHPHGFEATKKNWPKIRVGE